jgi:ornithine cyclodeaminase/alanine dehydrogenase-like protein (mu-crystallin family)
MPSRVSLKSIQGRAHVAGIILLSDAGTGMPVAIMDAAWITGVRTAAITAIAARHLAKPDSASVGFVACGLQARTHLSALLRHFPIRRVRAYSRRFSSAERFAQEARARGLVAEPVRSPSAAVEDMDIVITTTPVVPRTPAFLDATWLSPGSFAGIVDMGVSWITPSLATLDLAVTDDIAQADSERVNYPKPYDGEVAHLVAGLLQGRRTRQQRTALIFAGLGLADVAVGAAVYSSALEKNIGHVLPL